MIEITRKETYYVKTEKDYEGTIVCSDNCHKWAGCSFKKWINSDDDSIPQEGCPVYRLSPGEYVVSVQTEVSEYVRKEDGK